MKAEHVIIGQVYKVKVSGNLVKCQVLRKNLQFARSGYHKRLRFHLRNLTTGNYISRTGAALRKRQVLGTTVNRPNLNYNLYWEGRRAINKDRAFRRAFRQAISGGAA